MIGDHQDRPVWSANHHGRAVVVKRYRPFVGQQVFHDMRVLWASSFGVSRRPPGMPEPLTFDPTTGEVTMQHIGTATGPATCSDAAAILADLHHSGATPRRQRGAARLARSLSRKVADLSGTPVGEQAVDVVDHLASRPVGRAMAATHGDFSPANVVPTSLGTFIIDFDRLAYSSPVRDVAHWGAWVWARRATAGERPSWDEGDAFVEAYLTCAPELSDEVEEGLAYHRASALLRIVHGWSAMRADPHLSGIVLTEAKSLLT